MKSALIPCVAGFVLFMSPLLAAPDILDPTTTEDAASTSEQIDELFAKGMEEVHLQSGIDSLKQSLDLCAQEYAKRPGDCDVLWRYVRSCAQYAESVKGLQLVNWRDVCREWGKRGIDLGEIAKKIEPGRVEGYTWQTVCIGKYSDATGILAAPKENLIGRPRRT